MQLISETDNSLDRLDPADAQLDSWRAFLRSHAHVTRQLERELLAEHGMGLAEYDVLVQLAAAPDRQLRMSELADRLLLSRSGATRLIDRLEAAGQVERVSCESDRRGQWATLTTTGVERLRAAWPTHLRGIREHFLSRIPAGERRDLRRSLERLLP
jgi:DNA-binding MarR family transcriptional regulator